MRAKKHLEKCTEKCSYNPNGICYFGLWNIFKKCAKDGVEPKKQGSALE